MNEHGLLIEAESVNDLRPWRMDAEDAVHPQHGVAVNGDLAKLGPMAKELTCTRVFHTGPLTSSCCGWTPGRHLRDSAHIGSPALMAIARL